MTTVINLRNLKIDPREWVKDPKHIYIGRVSKKLPGSKWANDNLPEDFPSLEACIEKYREDLKKSPLMDEIHELKDSVLGCYCKPNKCHGDVLAEYANQPPNHSQSTGSNSKSKPEVVALSKSLSDEDEDDHDYILSDSSSSSDESFSSVDTLYDELELDSMENLSTCASQLIFKVNDLINLNKKLKKKLLALEKKYNDLSDKLYENEIYSAKQDQYIRRNNVELCCISEKVPDRQLEKYVIDLMKSLKIEVQRSDIVGCHRLGKFEQGKTRNVIVRFLNRKNAYRLLGASKKLKDSVNHEFRRIYIIENLCPMNKKIFGALYKLKKTQKIKAVWSYNGNVFFTELHDEEPWKVLHIEEIQYLFDDVSHNSSR